jgi:pSer/pThr/pTyr-binding forkhead associated (FHA) protein
LIIGSSGGGEGVELFLSFESKLEKLLDDFFQDGYRGRSGCRKWPESRSESLNGTYLDGVKIEKPVVLLDGDRIRAGKAVFQFVRWDYEVGCGN